MKSTFFTFLISSFIFPLFAETLVGELPGEFIVNNLGAASYTVPLSISPGTAGVEPKLAIRYSSRGGNGLLGVGFALDGLSAITRVGTSLAQDTFIDGVDFDDNDRFALDGQRLMLVSTNGAYGDAGTEYRTEIESFSRVVAVGQSGNGPASFKVWTKSGLIYEYGNTTDSAFKPGTNTTVLSWAVSKVSDTLGNTMTFTYDQTSAGPVISRIDYTGNTNASLSTYNSVEFVYEERPDDKLMFFKGVQMEQTNRLQKIVMKYNGSYMHDYRLSYTTNDAGQSVVESLQQFFGESAGADCLPETKFEFSGISSATNFSFTSGTNFFPTGIRLDQSTAKTVSGDFDGNGITDLLSVGSHEEDRWIALGTLNDGFGFITKYNCIPAAYDFESSNDGVLSGDFNGDGLTDVCVIASDRNRDWLGLSGGQGSFCFTNSVLPSGSTFDMWDKACGTGDFNGDGLTDIYGIGSDESDRWVGLSNGDGTFAFTTGTNFLPAANSPDFTVQTDTCRTGDFNGDGRTDICSIGSDLSDRWIGLSNGDGTFSFTSGTNFLPAADGSSFLTQEDACGTGDFNGDGLTDFYGVGADESDRWIGLSNGDGTFSFTTGYSFLPQTNSTYFNSASDFCGTGDFNGDGLTDLYGVGSAESDRWLALSVGDGTFSFTGGYAFVPATNASGFSVSADFCSTGDFNKDGLTDLCGIGTSASDRWMGFSNGDGTLRFSRLPQGMGDQCNVSVDACRTGDFNGDGQTDVLVIDSNEAYSWLALNGNEAARLEKVTQGYQNETEHGVVTEIEYLPITDTNIYIKGSGAIYPIRDIVSPIYVVSDMVKDNGQNGEYRTQYAYRSARYHVKGRGFLGFQQFISYDDETDLCYVETLSDKFPIIGRRLKTETLYVPDPAADPESAGYCQTNKVVDNDWFYDQVDGGTLFAYTAKSVETKWELGMTNSPATVVTAYNWFDGQDTNSLPPATQPTNLVAEITHGNLVKSVIDYGGGLKKTTVSSYNDLVTPTKWLLGRLQGSVVRHQASGQTDVVRSSSFDYDADTGLLDREVIEPGDAQFELITDYYYDEFGNITNKTLVPTNLPSRSVLANEYDSKGRFVEESRNALGHLTSFVNDQALGKPLSSTDPNGLTTEWRYDPTGRLVSEERPDGTVTTNSYIWDFTTTVETPLETSGSTTVVQRAAYKLHSETDGTPPVTKWYDKQGREIRLQTQSADGRTVNTDTGYNSIAQPVSVSEPYFAGSTPVWSYTEYDELGRPQYVTAPDGTVSEQVYEGLTTQAIKDSTGKHQVTTTVKNVKDEVLSVTDAMSNTVTYAYDSVGNLISTTDPDGNIIEMRYDIRGNKVWQNDPDMGEWNYTYNALDQLVFQQDANSNQIVTVYDVLGRATARTNWVMGTSGLEIESTAQWDYDGQGEGDKLGMLRLEEHFDANGEIINRKRYAYDDLSRPILELMNYDGKWYYTGLTYDAYSRVKKTHRCWKPKGKEDENLTAEWNRFTTVNIYNERGALLEVVDTDNHVWWEADASDYDQYGRLTQYEYGNGLVTTNTFNPLTGRLEGSAIRNTQYALSNYQFGYDHLGNLTSRSHSRLLMTTLSETCQYDALNRLRTNSVSGVTNFTTTATYDVLGNIQSRSGVGSYLYGTRPHAVTSAGDCDYIYDNNGNIVRRDRDSQYELTVKWNSFNKPVSLFSGVKGSEFSYDVNGRRTRQIIWEDLTNVTKKVYATPAYEMKEILLNPAETNRANWQWSMDYCRIYVDTPAGKIGIYQQAGSTNGVGEVTRSYIHKDHLGSVIATSDESANLTFMSYDAWGNRRDPDDWSPITDNSELLTDNCTDRGYTGHEMLYNLGLVHMNGRIYDPVIGRMISPDPLIQEPNNLQSFNRYSYVWNNPLSYSDPSGFVTEGLGTELRAADGSDDYENYAEPVSSGPLVGVGSSEGSSGLGLADGSAGMAGGSGSGLLGSGDPGDVLCPDDVIWYTFYNPITDEWEVVCSDQVEKRLNDLKKNGINQVALYKLKSEPSSTVRGATADGKGQGTETGKIVQNEENQDGSSETKSAEGGTGKDNEKFVNGVSERKFKTVTEAAIYASDYINGKSKKDDVEIGGFIVQNKNGTYSFTEPIVSKSGYSVSLGDKPDNARAAYHSHAASTRYAEYFSGSPDEESWGGSDVDYAEDKNIQVFLITPSDSIKLYSPYRDNFYLIREGADGEIQRTRY